MKKHIFTIMAGCVPVGEKMIESYFKYHLENINVYLFSDDLNKGNFNCCTVHILPDSLKEDFRHGHQGTAKVWARVIQANPDSYLIHIDSDVIFKKECISLIEKAGYPDIYGSRRCYQNNPGKAPVKEGLEDAISTYFIGFNSSLLSTIKQFDLERMIQGVYNPLGFPCLDFFDPCFFYIRSLNLRKRIGASQEFIEYRPSIYYEDQNIIGGQNELGSKLSNYPSNMHLDMGSHLAHFGGVGSGYQASKDDSGMNKDYSDWAKIRWQLFQNLFINNNNIEYNNAIFDQAGRWVSGQYNADIFNQIKKDLTS